MLAGFRRRLLELGRDHISERLALSKRIHQVEGEQQALAGEDKRYQQVQQQYEHRLRAYEAELGRYIPFDDSPHSESASAEV